MKVEYPNDRAMTEDEARELQYLEETIERAIDDGFLSREEFDSIKAKIFREGSTTVGQLNREIALYRQLVTEKLGTGELVIEGPR
jgi:hypothetical protein